MTDSLPKRDPYLDNAKLILVFLVVLGHLIQVFSRHKPYLLYFFFVIYGFHIPALVLVSGFLSKNYSSSQFVKHLFRLLIPYLIFDLFARIFHLLIDPSFKVFAYNLVPQGPLWYLLSLFFWRSFIPFFKKIPHLFIYSAIASLLVGFLLFINDQLSLSRTFVFFPFFIMGYRLPEANSLTALVKRHPPQPSCSNHHLPDDYLFCLPPLPSFICFWHVSLFKLLY